MNVAVSESADRDGSEFAFSDRDFKMIADQANIRYGLSLQPSKKALVYSRLAKRLRELQLKNFDEYCSLLQRAEGAAEQEHFLSALTTNVTHFFREMHHFEFLKNVLAPKLIAKCKAGQSVRIWSSACSSGQEAYSIAASLIAASPEVKSLDIKVLATDIDPKVVFTARQGSFPEDQLKAIPTQWRNTLLSKHTSSKGQFSISEDIRKIISFGELNLIDQWPMRRKFDVIFCRNAAIYFDKETQSRLWQRFADSIADGGHLMIGHSERLSGPANALFESVGITTYQRNGNASLPTDMNLDGETR